MIEDLRSERIPIDVETSPGTAADLFIYLLPLAVFIAFWMWLARRLRH